MEDENDVEVRKLNRKKPQKPENREGKHNTLQN